MKPVSLTIPTLVQAASITIAALFLCFPAWGDDPLKPRHPKAPLPVPDKWGTVDAPIYVRVTNPPPAPAVTVSLEPPKLSEGSGFSADSWTAVFTLLLVIVGVSQAALFFWQLRQIKESLRYAKDAADAAKKAVDIADSQVAVALAEFNASHRPKVRVRHFNVFLLQQGVHSFHPATRFTWSVNITNVGDSKITHMNVASIGIWEIDVPSALNAFIAHKKNEAINFELLPGKTIAHGFAPVEIPDAQELRRVHTGSFFVVGEVHYFDSAGIERVTGFCRNLERSNTGAPIQEFKLVDGVDYEYED